MHSRGQFTCMTYIGSVLRTRCVDHVASVALEIHHKFKEVIGAYVSKEGDSWLHFRHGGCAGDPFPGKDGQDNFVCTLTNE